jgi:PAS domain-containing protein
MPIATDFLPAARLPLPQVLSQARQVGECPVLITMLDIAPGMVALLNLERQIVFCNDACAKAGGLARKEDALGMRPGELLRCIHAADMPGGCGTGESCRYCGLMQALACISHRSSGIGEFRGEGLLCVAFLTDLKK